MTVAPLPLPRPPTLPRPQRLMGTARRRLPPDMGRRHFAVGLAKRLLPVVALVLLSLVALWPEINKDERSRWTAGIRGIEPQSGQLTDLHYRGVDDRDRPYAVTASGAQQISPERINLTDPKGDINLESGNWMMAQSRRGVYMPHANQLDLSGEVVLYRDDGLTMTTDAATLDLKGGVASSAEKVHVEGPFGTLDAQGFAVMDRGAVMQFTGPGRLVLNERPR
jgi:lipopolysaccharide export system protein LptC